MNTPCPGRSQCPASEPDRKAHQLRKIDRFLHTEFRRFMLSHRQQTVAEIISELSLGCGIRFVKIPKMDIISELCGISRTNVLGALQQLVNMRILTIDKEGSMPRYTLNINPETWQATPRIARIRIRAAKELIKTVNGMDASSEPDILEARKDIHDIYMANQDEETPGNFKVSIDTLFPSPESLDSIQSLSEQMVLTLQ